MNRLVNIITLCLGISFISSCGLAPPVASHAWPVLPADKSQRCAPPIGTYENSSEHVYFGGEGSSYEAPTLAQVLGVHSSGLGVTHVKIELVPENKLKISGFGIIDSAEVQVGEKYLDLADSFCHGGRWTIATTTTHISWDGGGQENYDPLFMVTMPIATMGVGLLVTPLSEWWRFSFAAADDGSLAIRRQRLSSSMLALVMYSRQVHEDDVFLYEFVDLSRLIQEHGDAPAVLVREESPLPEACTGRESDAKTPAELYAAGMNFYSKAIYEPAVECLRMAAEAPGNGSRQAMWQLCIVYELGQGVNPDLEVAKQWCKRASAD